MAVWTERDLDEAKTIYRALRRLKYHRTWRPYVKDMRRIGIIMLNLTFGLAFWGRTTTPRGGYDIPDFLSEGEEEVMWELLGIAFVERAPLPREMVPLIREVIWELKTRRYNSGFIYRF